MMEIQLDMSGAPPNPGDCFVSVRIGETQKLARFDGSRIYKFPQSVIKDRRYGKIELYQRLGGCSVNIDPSVEGLRQVDVPLKDREVQFNVGVQVPAIGEKPLPVEKQPNQKVTAAKDYLVAHNLEIQLSEAIQEVLRVRPNDPKEFLAAHLLGNGQPGQTQPVVKTPKNPAATYLCGSGPCTGVPKASETLPTAAHQSATTPTKPAGTYLCGSGPCTGVPKATETLPTAARQSATAPSAARQSATTLTNPAPTYLCGSGPSTGAPKASETLPTAARQSATVRAGSTASAAWQLKPSVGTWLANAPQGK